MNKTVATYFENLARLSKNDLTAFNLEPLKKSLKEEDLGVFQLDKDVVNAYSRSSRIAASIHYGCQSAKEIRNLHQVC